MGKGTRNHRKLKRGLKRGRKKRKGQKGVTGEIIPDPIKQMLGGGPNDHRLIGRNVVDVYCDGEEENPVEQIVDGLATSVEKDRRESFRSFAEPFVTMGQGGLPRITPVIFESSDIESPWTRKGSAAWTTPKTVTELKFGEMTKNQQVLYNAICAASGRPPADVITRSNFGWDLCYLSGSVKLDRQAADPRYLQLENCDRYAKVVLSEEAQQLWELLHEGGHTWAQSRTIVEWCAAFNVLFKQALESSVRDAQQWSNPIPWGRLIESLTLRHVAYLTKEYFKPCSCCVGDPCINVHDFGSAGTMVSFSFIDKPLDLKSIARDLIVLEDGHYVGEDP